MLERIPFEERRTLGFWNSFVRTWKLAALDPARFYPAAGETQDTTSAIFFFLITGMAGVLLGTCIRLLSALTLLPFLSTLPNAHVSPPVSFGFYLASHLFSSVFGLFFAPLLLFMVLFITSGLTHLFLLIVRGAPRGFSATLATFGYASAPNVIPLVGWVWSSILLILGLAYAHRTEPWKPVAAFLLQAVFLLLLFLVPLLLIIFFMIHHFSHPHAL